MNLGILQLRANNNKINNNGVNGLKGLEIRIFLVLYINIDIKVKVMTSLIHIIINSN